MMGKMRAISPPTGRCAVCGVELPAKPPGQPGPAPSYCSHAHRQAAYIARRPLAWRFCRDHGIEPVSLADELAELAR
jgi:hypothetical protein